MLNMEKTIELFGKKFRNPFPVVGKVFKYEMISGARIFIPVYAVLLTLSLIIGVFILDNNCDFDSDSPFGIAKMIIIVITIILLVVMNVILFSIFARRFKSSMLGDEAYLNLTLPVTIGEHLWGRYLADLAWGLSYTVVMILSVGLIYIRCWRFIPKGITHFLEASARFKLQHGVGFGYLISASFIYSMFLYILVCVFIYFTQTLIHMIGKHKTLIGVVTFAVVVVIYQNFGQVIFSWFDQDVFNLDYIADSVHKFSFCMNAYNILWIVLLSGAIRYMLNEKMNLD